jgi:membrane fusion protein, multidrug efflux system
VSPARPARRAHLAALAVAASVAGASPPATPSVDASTAEVLPVVASAAVAAQGGVGTTPFEGVVEAVRQTVVAAQVAGAVVALQVRAGDTVVAGQVLMRLDARAADQTAAAGAAQARAARATLEVATREFERQQQLFAQGYISQAALDRAEAHYKSAQADASAQGASAGAARSQSDLYVVKAPYGGVVANVAVVLGEMAMPGRPLLTLYDPGALRVTAAIPQTAVARLSAPLELQAEIPGATAGRVRPRRVQVLPTVDVASHTLELRLDLPAGTIAVPGMFARAWLPGAGAGTDAGATRLFVPSQSLLRRAEVAAVYVIGRDGKPLLRQVRPGRNEGGQVEILSGVAAGERVALDPQVAARLR